MTHTAANGVPFNARIIRHGDSYGLDDCLTHDEHEPMVEFFDARYPHTPNGQFVSRYYVTTLLGHRGGLCLDCGVADWTIDADTLAALLADATAQ